MKNKNIIPTNNENEVSNNNQWSDLEELGKKGFGWGRESVEVQSENLEKQETRNRRIADKVLTIFNWLKERVSGEYDFKQRPSINEMKQGNLPMAFPWLDLDDSWTDLFVEARTPSLPRKVARLLGIVTKEDKERQRRENMRSAMLELRQARIDGYEQEALAQKDKATKRQEEAVKREAEEKRREQEELLAGMQNIRTKKVERIENQRAQEIVERDLNSRLLKIDSLEEEVLSGNPEIEKHYITFEGEEIPVYDLKGIPFSILSTVVDYQENGKVGTDTYKEIMDDPSTWAKRRDEVENEVGWGVIDSSKTKGNTIFACYTNSEHNMYNRTKGELTYGFESVEADSVINIHAQDANTPNNIGNFDTRLSKGDVIAIDSLEKPYHSTVSPYSYNQIDLRRYSENGIPKKPDYVIVEDGNITETALRHAKYFHIPIVNIINKPYEEKMQEKGERIIDSFTSNDDYLEIDKRIAMLESISLFRGKYNEFESIGRKRDKDAHDPEQSPDPSEKKRLEILELEQNKRLDFIKNTLKETISRIEDATVSGLVVQGDIPGFTDFRVTLMDLQNELECTEYKDASYSAYSAPGNCNWIDITFKLDQEGCRDKYIRTRVYDGERIYRVNDIPESNRPTKEDLKEADSSLYNELEPIVRRYFKALRENRSLATTQSAQR